MKTLTSAEEKLKYQNFIKKWDAIIQSKNNKIVFFSFWQKWTFLHANLINTLSDEVRLNEKNSFWDKECHDFLLKRERIFSSFYQILLKDKKDTEWKIFLAQMLKNHDEFFSELLFQIQKKYYSELVQIQQKRKVSQAYLNSHTR